MRVAVIPARGGSKRVPRKNIRPFGGKPMLAWPIAAALASELFDHIVLSTDDDEIAETGRRSGAEVLFRRPAELANDHVGTTPVMRHATASLMELGWKPTAVCCIYPTAPFLEPEDLRRGLESLESADWAYAISATTFAAPIFRGFRQLDGGGLEMFFPEHFQTRSQDLPVALHDAAQFYWGRPAAWLTEHSLFGRETTPVLIPRWRVQDIDDEDDWTRAELMFESLRNRRQAGQP